MSARFSIIETAAWFKERDNFLVLTHRRPDGDTLGSAGALAQGLREIGKRVFLLHNPETTPRNEKFVSDYWVSGDFVPDHIVAVDTASVGLFPQNALCYKDDVSLCVDHHVSNTGYAKLLCCYPDYASCGEIIYEILTQMSGDVSVQSALRLYVAISTDTGCFVYGNTTANALKTAALLIERGAPHKELNKLLFRTKTRGRIAIEGMLYNNIEFHFDGKVAITVITRDMMKTSGAVEDDVDDISGIPTSIEGVDVGITIRELSSATDCKISVRSSGSFDASRLCIHFGGGGHRSAAGASIAKTIEEIKAELLKVLGGADGLPGSP
ncbi:MAG: DHH family phosphoesterase [Oscillospiraceae bacterium]|nr:DHH family phosphoesterase [Oscillospiraceae bacterium]